MLKTPCKEIIWDVLPFIRKELACNIVRSKKIPQKTAAEIIGITPAALSQYKCNKRGNYSSEDSKFINEIHISAEKIYTSGDQVVISEICRICKYIRSNNVIISSKDTKTS